MFNAILLLLGLAFAVFTNFIGLKFLRKFKTGQVVRVEGPQSHYAKAGTPTMGGLMIIAVINILAVLLLPTLSGFAITNEVKIILTLFTLTGLIGFLDDYLIVKHGKNKGLRSWYKLWGQFGIAVLFSSYLLKNGFNELVSPLLHVIGMNNPILYVMLASFIIIGTSNAVNLTDGLDGLAGGISAIVFLAFAFIANQFGNVQLMYLAIISSIGCLGFLVFNVKPAKMFMGDVGSLALGTLVAGFALLLHAELYLLLVGLVFVLETMSVIIQVASFKTTGKRVFKMAPLHHHFEAIGWHEKTIVRSAWLITLFMVMVAIFFRVR